MSDTPIKDQLGNVLGTIEDLMGKGVKGLYFRNLNREKPTRIVVSTPALITPNEEVLENNTTLDQLDDNTIGFCLNPRPTVNIQCIGAATAVAMEMKAGKRYKIVLNGATLTTSVSVMELRELLSEHGLEVDYALAPREYYCSEYTQSNTFTVILNTVETNKPLSFKITDTSTGEVIQQNITVGSTLFNIGTLGTIYIVRELIAIDGKVLLHFDLSQLTQLYGKEIKIEVKPQVTDFAAVEREFLVVPDGQEIPFESDLDKVIIFNDAAYACLVLGDVEDVD